MGLLRSGPSDSLTYFYEPDTHRLKRVLDNVPAVNYAEDTDYQPGNNYTYNAIGNLISDLSEGISSILSFSPRTAPPE